MKTIRCANPRCQREFVPDHEHRSLPYCCPMCQRECTPPPRMTGQRVTPNVSQTIIAPHVNRRAPGGTNRRQTE